MTIDTPLANWYFDFISPFAYLQWQYLSAFRDRLIIRPCPVVFGALLAHFENKGPAEIPAKRAFTYRFAQWQAEKSGVVMRFPPTHPFNPLPALRFAVALNCRLEAIDALFQHIWQEGRAGDSAEALQPVADKLGAGRVADMIEVPHVKKQLRDFTDEAIQKGVFGVPTMLIGKELFWGNDSSRMLDDWLNNPQRFERGDYPRLQNLPEGVQRLKR